MKAKLIEYLVCSHCKGTLKCKIYREDKNLPWPEIIEVDYSFDQSNNIFEVLKSLEAAILTAIVLVMITIIAVLGIGPALLVGFGIPITFTISFLIINLLGMTINIMVLFGLVLTVGMLVDLLPISTIGD